MSLTSRDFAAYFEAVHGVSPFPWQARLAEHVFEQGWPAAIDVPTGAGKTSAIDVAVFHLALAGPESAAVRIAFVVDRRIVVDEAFERADKIALALKNATRGVVSEVRQRLAALAERGAAPLVAVKLRGGMPRDPDWIRTPSQPAVITSTVDQVGSRVFFRGYGVSDSMKPVHAGLLGAQTLYLLDEAHLSQPFVQSLRDAREHFGLQSHVVTLSATQKEAVDELLSDADRGHEVLGRRLFAKKPVELIESNADKRVEVLLEKALKFSREARTVAVIVNRVGRAREVFTELEKRAGKDRVWLLTGRARPIERDRLVQRLLPLLRSSDGEKVIVVATQCIEAGADLDFDAMVTEVAPLDCLRQRFGRLNRQGRDIAARGAVVAAKDEIGKRAKEDSVYGATLGPTWRLLEEKSQNSVIDFGIEASRSWVPEGEELDALLAPREDAPVMLPAFIDQWICTSPIPTADPEVSLFLHGPRSGPPDVQIVWRADLKDSSHWKEWVSVCPPSALEAVSVPLYAARGWLGGAPADLPDVEAGGSSGSFVPGEFRKALRWRGPEDSDVAEQPSDIKPGDVLIVPVTYGGCDEWGWAPESGVSVRDLGEEANRRHRGIDVLRFSRAIVANALRDEGVEDADARAARFMSVVDQNREEADSVLQNGLASSAAAPERWHSILEDKGRMLRHGDALAFQRRVPRDEPSGTAATEDDISSRGTGAVPLSAHSAGVRDFASRFATQLRLPAPLAADLTLAAYLHDAGKAHPDFKTWLYGGDELAALAGQDLAKSGRYLSWRGSPGRHEIASLSFALAHPAFREAHDPELVLWLIGTHHGRGRPFFPSVQWPAVTETFAADLGDGRITSLPAIAISALTSRWCDLQKSLTRRYGPWGLARLEAILRLADHRRSEFEEEGA